MIIWPVLFAAVLAFDVAIWRVYGDAATASAWLQAWARSSPYHVLWFAVSWAWLAAHVLAGADLWALAAPLFWGTLIMYAWRQMQMVRL